MSDDLRELIGPATEPPAEAAPVVTAGAPFTYLPPPTPQDNPAVHPSSATRTIAIWLALIVMCAIVYVLFSGPAGTRTWRDVVLDVLQVAWPFLFVLLALAWLYRQMRGGTELTPRLAEGERARIAGQPARAIELFRSAAADYRTQGAYQAMARLHLGVTLAQAGQLDAAVTEFVAVERAGGLQFSADVRLQAVAQLALTLGLRGDLDAADRWLVDLDQRLARASTGGAREHVVATRALAALIVAARRGRPDEVVRIYDAAVAQLEAWLPVATLRVAWLIRAFAAARWDGPRELGAAEPWLRLIRGAPPAQLDYLATAWPELQAFRASVA